MTITPIVEIDRTGGGVVKEIITVLESPKGHIWALLTVTISSTSSGKTDYDFNEIALVTQKGKRLIPCSSRRVIKLLPFYLVRTVDPKYLYLVS